MSTRPDHSENAGRVGTPISGTPGEPTQSSDNVDVCEVCGSARVAWRNCKLICANCRSIVKSCADL